MQKMELYIYNSKNQPQPISIYIGCEALGPSYIYSSGSVLEVLSLFLSVNGQGTPSPAEDLCILHKLAYGLSTTNVSNIII